MHRQVGRVAPRAVTQPSCSSRFKTSLPNGAGHAIDPVVGGPEFRVHSADVLDKRINITGFYRRRYINDVSAVEVEANAPQHW